MYVQVVYISLGDELVGGHSHSYVAITSWAGNVVKLPGLPWLQRLPPAPEKDIMIRFIP